MGRPGLTETLSILFAGVIALIGLAALDGSAHRASTERALAALNDRQRIVRVEQREEESTARARAEARVEGSGRAPLFIPTRGGALGISPGVAITEEDFAVSAVSSTTALRRVEGPRTTSDRTERSDPTPAFIREAVRKPAPKAPAATMPAAVASAPGPSAPDRPSPGALWLVALAGLGVVFCAAGLLVSARR